MQTQAAFDLDHDDDGVADHLQPHASSILTAGNQWLTYRNNGNRNQSNLVASPAPQNATFYMV